MHPNLGSNYTRAVLSRTAHNSHVEGIVEQGDSLLSEPDSDTERPRLSVAGAVLRIWPT